MSTLITTSGLAVLSFLALFFPWTESTSARQPAGKAECDESSKIEILKLRDFSGKDFEMQWSGAAGASCPGAGFPRLILQHSEVDDYVHSVVADVDTPREHFKDSSWNPLNLKFPWIFVDLSQESRKQKSIFYTRGNTFHDNPQWGSKSLFWLGSLYGLKKEKAGSYRPVLGLSWGFVVNNGRVQALNPEELSQRDWIKDIGVFNTLLQSWKLEANWKIPRPLISPAVQK